MTAEDVIKRINDLKIECMGKSVKSFGAPVKGWGKKYKHGLGEAYADIVEKLQKLIDDIYEAAGRE